MQFCLKLQDATLYMEFPTTAMEAAVSGPVCDALWMAVSPLIWSPSVWVYALSTMCVNHATVGVLYDSTLALTICISATLCSTKYFERTATISKYEFSR